MRYRDIVTERFVTTLKPDYGNRQPFDVFKNPSAKEWREARGPDHSVRAWVVGDDVFVWNTFGDLHVNVHQALGLDAQAIPVILYGDLRNEAGAMVTDASKRTIWYHNPEVADAIQDCGYLVRMFDDVEVLYFDEAIVGDWRELGEDD